MISRCGIDAPCSFQVSNPSSVGESSCFPLELKPHPKKNRALKWGSHSINGIISLTYIYIYNIITGISMYLAPCPEGLSHFQTQNTVTLSERKKGSTAMDQTLPLLE